MTAPEPTEPQATSFATGPRTRGIGLYSEVPSRQAQPPRNSDGENAPVRIAEVRKVFLPED